MRAQSTLLPAVLRHLIVACVLVACAMAAGAESLRPNIVVILADDLGYGDLRCYGAKDIRTPNLDRMAQEGVRFTDFYGENVCTPARAALLTGAYPKRVGLHVAVLPPESKAGLHPNEITLAELLKTRGYATACIGKWHLGSTPELLPTAQGFDSYFGMPGPNHGRSDLYRGTELITKNADLQLDQLTRRYTEEATHFIRESRDKPFFLYLAHSAVHIPLFASEKFRGHSQAGLYGDMTEELDWSCGEIVKALRELQLDEKTVVIFTSDNGQSGRAAPPLHGGKGSTWEAGLRVPFIARWPGQIPAGAVCHELATLKDLTPTLAPLAGATMPKDRIVDGHDILPLLRAEPRAKSRTPRLFYYARSGKLAAVREGDWKLHLLEPEERWWGKIASGGLIETKPTSPPPWLYNLNDDLGETHNVAEAHPEVVARLQKAAEEFDRDLEAHSRPIYRSAP
jgi:arylsulfatase A-like enzyme